jgi:hypothetical protein
MDKQRFDRRIVLGVLPREKGKRKQWQVRCNCGHEFVCLTQDLHRGGPCMMCGHKGPRPWMRKRPYETNYKSLLKRSKHIVRITYDQFVSFTAIKDCHYCGAIIPWQKYRTKHSGSGSFLDRKDSDGAYEMGNLVVCCARCNYGKSYRFTYDEWVQIGNLIRSWKT